MPSPTDPPGAGGSDCAVAGPGGLPAPQPKAAGATPRKIAAVAVLIASLLSSAAQGKEAEKVLVSLPVPAKINTRAVKTILVARFIAPDFPGLDVGREFVRYTRHELEKGTRIKILDVDPPALPEQPIEDLLKNTVFWKHIAEEFGADLIVSGRVVFTSADRSGFVQEDVVSPVTGQKLRTTQYVERTEFTLETNLWFFKGANGAFLYEDTFRNRQVYDGKSNDPLQTFYNLTERLTPDLLGVVVSQRRREARYIFDE